MSAFSLKLVISVDTPEYIIGTDITVGQYYSKRERVCVNFDEARYLKNT